MSNRRAGFLMIFLAASGYAFLPTITRTLYMVSDLRPTDIAVWRFILATPLIWLALSWQRSPRVKNLPYGQLAMLGIFYAWAALAAFAGLEFIPASTFVVLFYTYPAYVAILSYFGGQPIMRTTWVALALTLLGVALTVPDFATLQGANLTGVLIALGNAFIVAVYFMASNRIIGQIGSVMVSTAWVMTGTLVAVLAFVPFMGLRVPDSSETWLLLLMLALVSTTAPITLLNAGIQRIGPARASIVSAVEPVQAMVLALILLGEVILPVQWMGAVLIVSAVILLEAFPARKTASIG